MILINIYVYFVIYHLKKDVLNVKKFIIVMLIVKNNVILYINMTVNKKIFRNMYIINFTLSEFRFIDIGGDAIIILNYF